MKRIKDGKTPQPAGSIVERPLSRRDLLKGMGAAGVGLVAAASGLAAGQEERPQLFAVGRGRRTITYWTWANSNDDNPRARAQKMILDEFRSQNPDIEVDEQVIAWQQLRQQLIQSAAAGRSPDVSRQIDNFVGTLASARALYPLDEFVAGWDDERRADYTHAWSDTVVDGRKWAFRQAVRPSNLLYYRSDLLEAAGFDGPPTTWDAFMEVSEAMTRGPVSGFIAPFSKSDNISHVMQHLPPMLWAMGSDFIDPATSRPTFHHAQGVALVTWFQDLVHEHRIMPIGVATMDAEAADQMFLGGLAGNIFANTAKWGQWSTREGVQGRLATAPFPNWGNDSAVPGSANNGGGWCLVMGKDAQTEEAWRFMEFMQSAEIELIDAQVGGEIPTRQSVLEHPWFETEEAQRMRGYINWMSANPHEATTLRIERAEVFTDILGTAMQEIMVNRADVATTLSNAAERYEAQLA